MRERDKRDPWVVLLASVLLGCGGNAGGPPVPPGPTAIPGDRKLMTLTPSEAAVICDDLRGLSDLQHLAAECVQAQRDRVGPAARDDRPDVR